MFVLSAIDVVIIVASILIVMIVGLIASRNQDKSAKGYFLASGRLPWYIIGAAFVSTSVSSEQIVGTVGQAYKSGMGVANWEWWSLPVYSMLIVFFIPMFLRSKITTIPDFLTRRFGQLCGDIYSWVMLFAYVVIFLVPVVYGGSLTFSMLTGFNFYAVLWVTIILVGAYSIKGGLSSVMWTDAVQCSMLLGGGIILFFIALAQIPGGWHVMVHANPQRFHLYYPPSDPAAPFLGMLLGSVGVFIFYSAGNQVMIQRVLGARSLWDGMMGIVFAGIINMARPLVTCFLGLIVYHWINVMHQAPALAKPDDAFPFALQNFAPGWGLRGIILAGFLAAVMSTISALANSTATIFSLDVYHKVINKNASDVQLVKVGRLASMIALITAGIIAPVVSKIGIFMYFQTGVTYLAVPFITVVLFGLLWKRTNYEAARFGLIGGIVILIGVIIADHLLRSNGIYAQWGIPNGLHWIYQGFIAQVIIAIGMIIVALRHPAPAESQWKPFQWFPSQLKQLNDGISRPWYQSVALWFGVFAVIWVAAYWKFW
ncbi:MAG: sodium/solute symporter [Armatimonadota bacterium]|nr:sodium/solute symporter [bacterium]